MSKMMKKYIKSQAKYIKKGYYSDKYFQRTREILQNDGEKHHVTMQVFNKKHSMLCGINEAIELLHICADKPRKLEIKALSDGRMVLPQETVMTIEGELANFAHLETLYLGILARRTRIATNVRKVVMAANKKEILFFPARFDHFLNQQGDGYAAMVAGATAVSTDAQGEWLGIEGVGTVPHALIAAYNGNTPKATVAFARKYPEVRCISLVDFHNNCPNTAREVARRMKNEGLRLYGVRLDNSATVVDYSIVNKEQFGTYKPTGVCPQLVWNVRDELDSHGFEDVKIFVSGGFNEEKTTMFESMKLPVDGYGVGSSLFKGNYDFTADVVELNGESCAKVGRQLNPNRKLKLIKMGRY